MGETTHESGLQAMFRTEEERKIANILDILRFNYDYIPADIRIPDGKGNTRKWFPDFLITEKGIAVEYISSTKRSLENIRGKPKKFYMRGDYYVVPIYPEEANSPASGTLGTVFSKRYESAIKAKEGKR